MRKVLKRKALFPLIFFIFINFLILFSVNLENDDFISENSVYNPENPEISYYNNSLQPIYINGAATGIGAHNWDWALSKPWCSFVEGVYIIENVVINNQDQDNCILIENSNISFTIRNCSVLSSGLGFAGIKLKNTNNSLLTNNNFSSKNVGIYLENSHFNIVSNNTAFYNDDFGIFLRSNSDDNTILGNDLQYNGNNGIRLQNGCKKNEIVGNTIRNNSQYGIFVHYDIDQSRNNLFYLNNLTGNNGNAMDNGLENSWDDGSYGNYWGDYAGVDNDGDCIGDTPYEIDPGSQDNFPLMANWTPPEPPEIFHLSSNAGNPDKDGVFNLTWTESHGADNYSVYTSDKQIVKIDENIKLLAYQNATSPLLVSGLLTGEYYFIVVAYNNSGETVSNNRYVVVQLPGDGPLPNDGYKNNDGVILTIVIVIISVATITFLGVIRTYKPKKRSSSSIARGVKTINRTIKSNTQLTSKQKAQKISRIPKPIQESPDKIISTKKEIELYEIFKNETSKNAIWHGKITIGYLAWKEKRDKIKASVSQHQLSNDIDLQQQFEEETGKNAIWHGKITKGYLTWKEKYEKNKKNR